MSCESGLFNLPSPILADILSRLPIHTIIQCKSVCKTWLKLLSEPEFVNLHLSKSSTRLIINKFSTSPPNANWFNLVELQDEPNHHELHYLEGTEMELQRTRPGVDATMIGSINGLICLNEFEGPYDIVKIWNPTMRACITIESSPKEGKRVYPNIVSYGFGLSSVKGQYKAVRIFQEVNIDDSNTGQRRICKSECYVYTIGEGSWRGIGYAPFMYNCREHGIFLNGNLHWLINDLDGSELISCLDIEKEMFQPFPAPPELSRHNLATVNLYGELLCICDNTSDSEIVIWVMKEYGVKNSWSKEFVISKLNSLSIDLFGNNYEVAHVIKVFKDGQILLLWRDDLLVCYNPHKKSLSTLEVRELMGTAKKKTCCFEELFPCIEAMDYVSSLLSLENFGIEIVKKI